MKSFYFTKDTIDMIISKLEVKDGDTILLTLNLDDYAVTDSVDELYKQAKKAFPKNKVIITFKGIEIAAGAGPSPK